MEMVDQTIPTPERDLEIPIPDARGSRAQHPGQGLCDHWEAGEG
jgi:hypothetical protein